METRQDKERFDVVGFIMEYEGGELEDEQELIDGFQHLIDDGTVWALQGSYGRMAQRLIDAELCTRMTQTSGGS